MIDNLPFLNNDVLLNLLNNLPGAFYRCLNDNEWTMIYISDGCERLIGYTAEEILFNKSVSYAALIHPEDQEWLTKKCMQNLKSKIQCNNEYRIVCRQGRIKWVREIANGVYDKNDNLIYIEGFIQDITAERDNLLLDNAFNSYQNAINKSSLVSITDPNGTIIFANDLFCKYSKYSRKELIGQNHRVVNSRYHDKIFFSTMWQTIRAGKIWRGEVKNKAKDGSYYWVDTVITPVLNNRNEIIQFLSIRNIITEKKKMEQTLIANKNELNKAVLDVTKHYNDMLQFNYIVSHNLRSPIANLLGLCDVLSTNKHSNEEINIVVDYIRTAANKLDDTIKDLNLILSARSNVPSKQHLSLRDVVRSIMSLLNRKIKSAEAMVHIDIPDDADGLYTIKVYLESVIYNLLDNAVKYRSPERTLVVYLSARKNNRVTTITIRDNGLGFDLTNCGDKLFGLYQRFHSHIEGKGLGLHMSKMQLDSLGGSISVESQVDQGSAFTIIIPFGPAQTFDSDIQSN